MITRNNVSVPRLLAEIVITNSECAQTYIEGNFLFIGKARSNFYLSVWNLLTSRINTHFCVDKKSSLSH